MHEVARPVAADPAPTFVRIAQRREQTLHAGQRPDPATGARAVLSEMKATLGTDCAQHARLVDQARELRDELPVMTGIAWSAIIAS